MFVRRAGRRVRAVVDGVARLGDADLSSRVAAVRGAEVGSVECLSLAVAAVARTIGRPLTDGEVAAGVALCAGIALDDLGISDTSVVLAVPTVAHAVRGGGTHHVSPTHDDAVRHAAWLGPVAAAVGLRVGLLEPGDQATRRESHRADIVCGAVDEFAYDVLRDWLTWEEEPVTAARRVAVVDQVDVVLLDLGDTTPRVSAPADSADSAADEWRQWAADTAKQLGDRHRTPEGLSADGIQHILDLVDLTDVYRDRVPVFRMVADTLAGRREPDMVLARTTVRNHLLRYDLVTGVGVVDETAARRLRELYDLPARPRKADVPARDDVVCADDDELREAVRAAARDSDRPVVFAAATDELTAFAPDALGPADPVPHGPHLLVGIGRHLTRRRDLRLARAAAEARFFVTVAHVEAKGGGHEPHKVAKWQANHELAVHYYYADRRAEDDVREAHLDELTARCTALTEETFRQHLHDHLDTLVGHLRDGDLGYRELLELLGELYPCDLPAQPPADLAGAVMADADRALAARVAEVGPHLATVVTQVVASVRDRLWRGHLVNLGTLGVVCWHTLPQRNRAAGFAERAGDQFALLWLELVAETISYVFNLEIESAPTG